MSIKRVFIYLIAFIVPPLTLGLTLTFHTLSQLMVHQAPPPFETPEQKPADAHKSVAPTGKLKAMIVLSNSGTEITELLGTYEILA